MHIKKALKSDLTNNTEIVKKIMPGMKWYGSRRFTHKGLEGSVSLNDLWKSIDKFTVTASLSEAERSSLSQAIVNLENLDKEQLKANWLARKLHIIAHFFGNLFFNRVKVIDKLKNLISANNEKKIPSSDVAVDPDADSGQIVRKKRSPRAIPPPNPPLPIEEEAYAETFNEELCFQFQKENEELAIILGPKILFHIHGGNFGGTSKLEGSDALTMLKVNLSYLKSQYKQKPYQRLKEIIRKLKDAFEIASWKAVLRNKIETCPLKQKTLWKAFLRNKIETCLLKQKTLLIPGGWAGDEGQAGHSVYYEIIPTSPDAATFRIYNLGAGANYHHKEYDSKKKKVSPYVDFLEVPFAKLQNSLFIQALKELKEQNVGGDNSFSEVDVYEGFGKLLGVIGKLEFQPETKQRPMSPQEVGLCSFRSLCAFMATQMTKSEYKKWKCDLKIQSLIIVESQPLVSNHLILRDFNLLFKSLKKTSNTIVRLAEKKLLQPEYVKEAQEVLQPIKQKLQIEKPKVMKRISIVIETPSYVPFICFEAPRFSDTSKGKDALDEVGTSSFLFKKQIQLFHEDLSKGKVKGLISLIEICNRAASVGEYFAIQSGLADFIIDLKGGSLSKNKETIEQLGLIAEIYFEAFLKDSNSYKVTDETFFLFAKLRELQCSCLKVLFPENSPEFSTGPNFKLFFPQERMQRQLKNFSSFSSEGIFRFLNRTYSKDKTFSFELKDGVFTKLIEGCANEEFDKWRKREEKPVTELSYMEFFISQDLPAWLKGLRNLWLIYGAVDHEYEFGAASERKINLQIESVARAEQGEIGLKFSFLGTVHVDGGYPYNLFKERPFFSKGLQAFFNAIQTAGAEKRWLTADDSANRYGMTPEEYKDLYRIFSDTNRTIECIAYFTKNFQNLKNPDYQVFFQQAFFHQKLFKDLNTDPILSEKISSCLYQAYQHLLNTHEIQASVFVLQMMRYLSSMPHAKLELNLEKELKKLFLRPGINFEEKSAIQAEIAASLSAKNSLNDSEIEALLTALTFLQRFPLPKKWQDPYVDRDIKKAAHKHTDSLRNFISRQDSKFVNKIVKILYTEERDYLWKLDENKGLPVFISDHSTFSPLLGKLLLESQLNAKVPLPSSITKHAAFIELFSNITEGILLPSGEYLFRDSRDHETRVGLNEKNNKIHFYQNRDSKKYRYMSRDELVVYKSERYDDAEKPVFQIHSRAITERLCAWQSLKDPNDVIFIDSRTGQIAYSIQPNKTFYDLKDLVRKDDGLILGKATDLFSLIEDPSYVHSWYENTKSPQDVVEYELPRFGLKFIQNPENRAQFFCEQIKGFFLRSDTPYLTGLPLGSYSNYLVLENDEGQKKVIFPLQEMQKPDRYESLEPSFKINRELTSGYSAQKYLVFDLLDNRLRHSLRSANLFLVKILTLSQDYSEAALLLNRIGTKHTPYTSSELAQLKSIADLKSITAARDPDMIAIMTYAELLLARHNQIDASPCYLSYLRALNNISVGKLSSFDELFLIKKNLNKGFNATLFLRLRELDPVAAKNFKNPLFTDLQTNFKSNSFKLPRYLWFWAEEGKVRATLNLQKITRIDPSNFFSFYELARTANLNEKDWLLTAFIFNSINRNSECLNLLEVVTKFPKAFPSYKTLNCDEDKEQIIKIAEDLYRKHPEEFSRLSYPKDQPRLRAQKAEIEQAFEPTLRPLQLTQKVDSFIRKIEDFFDVTAQEHDSNATEEIMTCLEQFKEEGELALNTQIDVSKEDLKAYSEIPLKPYYELNTNLSAIEELLAPSLLNQEKLESLEKEILILANKQSSDKEEAILDDLRLIAESKKLFTLEELIINFGGQEGAFLQNRNKALADKDIEELYSKIGDYLILATHEQQRQSCLGLVDKIKTSKNDSEISVLTQELAEALQAKRSYDPTQNPAFLSFEYFLKILIREEQKNKIVDFKEIPNAVLQMIMGSGKTSVLLQLLGYTLAKGDNIVLFVVPSPLFENVASLTQHIQQTAYAKQPISLKVERKTQITPYMLENLLDDLKRAKQSKECIIMTSKSVACLALKYIELLVSSEGWEEEIKLLDQIIEELASNGLAILDEIDTLLNVLHEVSFSLGKMIPVDESESLTIAVLYDLVYNDPSIKALAYVESDPKPNLEVPLISDELYHSKIKERLAELFIERLPNLQFESPIMRNALRKLSAQSKEDKSLLKAYLCHDPLKLAQAEEYFKKLSPLIKDVVALAGEEINYLLPHTLSLNSNEKYGLDPTGILAIPYSAANTPSRESDFKSSHVTINATFQIYFKYGVTKKIIKQVLERLQKKYFAELKEDPNLDMKDSEAWKTFKKITDPLDLSLLKYNKAQIVKLLEHTNSSSQTISHFVIHGALPFLKRFDESITFNAQNLPALFDNLKGFSGTHWNASTMYQRLKSMPELGTDAKTLCILFKNSRYAVDVVPKASLENILSSDFDALIEAGGYFKEKSSASTARSIARASNTVTGFFSKKDAKKITDGKQKLELKEVDTNQRWFIDQSHCTGADVKLRTTAKGIVTIGRNMLLRDLLQSAWRMRGLDKGQTISFLISDEVESLIRKACKKEDGKIILDDILRFVIHNQSKRLSRDNFTALKQQQINLVQMMILKAKRAGLLEKELELIRPLLRQLWVQKATLSPKEQYGPLAKIRDSKDILNEEKMRVARLIDRCFITLPSLKNHFDKEEILKEIDGISDHFKPLLPDRIMSKSNEESKTVEQESDVEQEKEVETVQHKFVEQSNIEYRSFFKLKQIEDLSNMKKGENYLSVPLYMKTYPDLAEYAEAFEGIDMTLNFLQFEKSKEIYDPKDLKLFGTARTPISTIGIKKDGSILLYSLEEYKCWNSIRYNLTLGLLDSFKMTPKVMLNIIKVKFLNGESNFKKEERGFLKDWIEDNDPKVMQKLYFEHILSGFPIKTEEYAQSDLKKIFDELSLNSKTRQH